MEEAWWFWQCPACPKHKWTCGREKAGEALKNHMKGTHENHPLLFDKVFKSTILEGENDCIKRTIDGEDDQPAKKKRKIEIQPETTNTIAISNIDVRTSFEEIMNAAAEYGFVEQLRIYTVEYPKIYGFVRYRTTYSVEYAMNGLHGRVLGGGGLAVRCHRVAARE